jgi:sugar lactone lactonase YvrE
MRSHVAYTMSALALVACSDAPKAESTTLAAPAGAVLISETSGLNVPESVRYDAELDVFYVSNVNGGPSQKDNNGFIVRIRADNTTSATTFIEGGDNGVTLNAPKGMAIVGDTLWVADIDAVRGFNRRTGDPVRSYELGSKATFLNDVVATPDGSIYITDTGIKFDAKGNVTHPGKDAIFRMTAGSKTGPAVLFASDSLSRPNGIAWIPASSTQPGKLLLAPFGGPNIQTWAPGDKQPTTLTSGPGGYDGLEVLANGNVLVSSWTDSTVWIAHGGTHMVPLIKGVSAPADIGVDTKRNVLAVPRFNDGRVEFYKLP